MYCFKANCKITTFCNEIVVQHCYIQQQKASDQLLSVDAECILNEMITSLVQASKIRDLQPSTATGAWSVCSVRFFWFDIISETPSRCSHKEKQLLLPARICLGLRENILGMGWGISSQSENPLQVFSRKHGYYSREKCPTKGKISHKEGVSTVFCSKQQRWKVGLKALVCVCVRMCPPSFLMYDILIQLFTYISSENLNRYYMTLRKPSY